jgi:hypothetical protein
MIKPITYGRAGNYFFQLAAAIAYAKRHGLEYTAPSSTNDPKWNPIYCKHLVNKNFNPHLPSIQIDQPHGSGYSPIEFKEEWRDKNIILNGYWQSLKYFEDYFDEVITAFNFPWIHKSDLVSVHVRRGDYCHFVDKHPPIPIEWYEKAMKEFPGKKFKFYSDDIKYCLDHFGERDDCEFAFGNEIEDLIDMSSCESHICSSSTYALWGYFLNKFENKKAIFPKLWFMPGWDSWVTKDILPPEVIKL